MYCSKCGTQLPDGTQFCSQCGAKQNTAPGGQASPVGQQQARAAAPTPAASGASGIKVDTWPMVIVVLYGIALILLLILMNNPMSMIPIFITMVIVSLATLVIEIVDLVYLSKIGVRGGWKWSVLIYPLYLFLRASKTNHKYTWAVIYLIEFIIGMIIYFAASAVLGSLAMYAIGGGYLY